MRDTAFGIQIPETDPDRLTAEIGKQEAAAERARRIFAWDRAAWFGNREQRRRGMKGAKGVMRPLTRAEKLHRRARRRMAAASRRANR